MVINFDRFIQLRTIESDSWFFLLTHDLAVIATVLENEYVADVVDVSYYFRFGSSIFHSELFSFIDVMIYSLVFIH